MTRIARVVIPGCPHHVIQRGNRRQVVFFHPEDKYLYLRFLKYHCRKENLDIWCYCLMDNHVHLIAVPQKPESLAKVVGAVHRKYTIMINTPNNWKGYLWQGRFLSYPMDGKHLYLAVRYIERNPVRAGLVKKPEDYPWSSARAHIMGTMDECLTDFYLLSEIKNWREYLEEEKEEDRKIFREHEKSGWPLGSENFIQKLELITGRRLRKRKPGRPSLTERRSGYREK